MSLSSRRSHPRVRSMLVLGCVALSLASCGASSGKTSTVGHTPSPTLSPASATFSSLFTFNSSTTESATLDHLSVQSLAGVSCGGTVVLKGDPAAYDAGSIQSIGTDLRTGNFSSGVLQAVPGDVFAADFGAPNNCKQQTPIAITNLSDSTITLKGIAITYVVTSLTNSYHYNVVDCIAYEPGCAPGGAAVPGCFVKFSLSPGKAGTSLEQDCVPEQIVTPQQSTAVFLSFASTPTSELYKISLSLVLGDGTRITLPQNFDNALVFDSPGQFTCYSPVGGRLVQIPMQETASHVCY
jgi:hypothetical protein